MSEKVYKRGVVIGDEETILLFRSLGFKALIAYDESQVIDHLKELAGKEEIGLAIIPKHVIKNEDKIREEAKRLGLPVLILPTRRSPSTPININALIARALGFG